MIKLLSGKRIKDVTSGYRAINKKIMAIFVNYYPYDIWISRYGLLIELDGIQHFTDTYEFFEQNTPFEKRVEHDNIKNQFAFEKRIPLLRIPYTYNPDTEEEKIRQILKEFIAYSKKELRYKREWEICIDFNCYDKYLITKNKPYFCLEELQAINKKVKELGWYE